MSDAEVRTREFFDNLKYGQPEAVLRGALARPVELFVPAPLAGTRDVQCAVFTLVNEAFRLGEYCPPLTVHLPARTQVADLPLLQGGAFAASIQAFLAQLPFHAPLRFVDDLVSGCSLAATVGTKRLTMACDGWVLHQNLGSAHPWTDTNPIIAALAGTLLLTEVMKEVLRPVVGRTVETPPQAFNLWSYGLGDLKAPPCPTTVYLDDVVLVGVGGIGSAVVFALLLTDVRGSISLVDGDGVDETNLNRLLYAVAADAAAGVMKVDLAKGLLGRHRELDVRRYPRPWRKFVDSDRRDRLFPLVLGGVDDDRVRWEIQRDFPQVYLDGGTGRRNWRVSVHDVLTGGCFFCVADPRAPGNAVAAGLRDLGVLDAAVEHRLQTGTSFEDGDLRNVATEVAGMLLGRTPDQAWAAYQGSLRCGEVELLHGQHASLPYLSATPGLLMAVELLKAGEEGRGCPPLNGSLNQLRGEMFGRLHEGTVDRYVRPSCSFCRDEEIRQLHHDKWAGRAAWRRGPMASYAGHPS